ncbi:Hypothetical predicted protein [Paramuricea clavata]|uniref:Uncharacterized protein n=1 Tax=Paramuricea clavata TaxID=317549 RepID=A0A7D9ITG5_PARCT|nr:Hypothetical predicted protein [Paramuricea clavata]
MEDNAKAYDQLLSKTQYESGCKFISEFINLCPGDKVLDMGCGTGQITKYIADIVGPDGQAVGIDPDTARIKIAEEKYKEASHLQFHVGSSVTAFPHDNELYYDVHLSTSAFHWLSNEEKPIYIQKAYDCLKPGGRLAIWCVEVPLDINVLGLPVNEAKNRFQLTLIIKYTENYKIVISGKTLFSFARHISSHAHALTKRKKHRSKGDRRDYCLQLYYNPIHRKDWGRCDRVLKSECKFL